MLAANLKPNYVPSALRQKLEGEIWVDNAVDYMFQIKLFDRSEEAQAIELAENLLYSNRDEGGDIIEMDVQVVIDEELTYWGD